MYKHILIALDGSQAAGHALSHGIELAKLVGARITVVTVTEMWSAIEMAGQTSGHITRATDEFEKKQDARADQIVAPAIEMAKAAGVSYETVHVADSPPAEGIVKTAEALDCDLIVMGSHGRGSVQRMLLGSVVANVLALTMRPVLVHR